MLAIFIGAFIGGIDEYRDIFANAYKSINNHNIDSIAIDIEEYRYSRLS